jgi:hypothetical protein
VYVDLSVKHFQITVTGPDVGGEWLELLLALREVSGSYLGPETGYPN